MSRSERGDAGARDVGERSEPESRAPELPPEGTPGGSYTPGEKEAALRAFASSGRGMREWCAARGISTATLCAWRRAFARGGREGLQPRPNPRNRQGAATQRSYSPEERRATIAAYERSGMTQLAFCRLWGLSATSLGRWLRAYRAHGPKGLESPWGTGRRGRKKRPVPDAVRAEIVATKSREPTWGLRRIRDVLARFSGLRVGLHRVREVVREEGLEAPAPKRKVRRSPPKVRRFERARPRELWQSDITSYVLTRHSQRVYLTVFLDDHSRYVVSWALAVHQRGELVTECLLEGVARFGKPREVLTDQGRQYFAWRGKSRFQKLLVREGISHVVSRAHHPETLGKCERLWKTVGDELWARARPQDLEEARRRLGHFFDHYNHFRPHQGIGGLVPADRFFGAETVVREEIERQMDQNALRLALGDPPRREVFLHGQIDGERVALYGERGRLVIQRPGQAPEAIGMQSLGAPGGRDESERDEQDERGEVGDHVGGIDEDDRDGDGDPDGAALGDEGAGASAASHAPEERATSAGAGEGAVGGGECGGARARAPSCDGDAGVLDRAAEQERGGRGTGCDAAARVADEPDGGGGHGVRPAAPAALAQGDERDGDGPRERPQAAQEGERAAQARARGGQAADRPPEDLAGQRGPGARGPGEARSSGRVRQGDDEESEGGDEGGPGVATSRLPGPQAAGPGSEASGDPDSTPDSTLDSTPWWESAWGVIFDEWERDGERGR